MSLYSFQYMYMYTKYTYKLFYLYKVKTGIYKYI